MFSRQANIYLKIPRANGSQEVSSKHTVRIIGMSVLIIPTFKILKNRLLDGG